MKLTKAFVAKFNRWAELMVDNEEMTPEEIEETKASIRQDAQDGPDNLRRNGFQIATAEERIAHWERYFDWWLPEESGINERINGARKEAA